MEPAALGRVLILVLLFVILRAGFGPKGLAFDVASCHPEGLLLARRILWLTFAPTTHSCRRKQTTRSFGKTASGRQRVLCVNKKSSSSAIDLAFRRGYGPMNKRLPPCNQAEELTKSKSTTRIPRILRIGRIKKIGKSRFPKKQNGLSVRSVAIREIRVPAFELTVRNSKCDCPDSMLLELLFLARHVKGQRSQIRIGLITPFGLHDQSIGNRVEAPAFMRGKLRFSAAGKARSQIIAL
ncbi:MAG TPA: hypothetical protein VFQ00_01995 [Terriglobales bacterium]|nr:hypothetical protein [Terriglobales bacterium]